MLLIQESLKVASKAFSLIGLRIQDQTADSFRHHHGYIMKLALIFKKSGRSFIEKSLRNGSVAGSWLAQDTHLSIHPATTYPGQHHRGVWTQIQAA